jgi:RNA polymerase sigma-70 factor (ECF subfamily)
MGVIVSDPGLARRFEALAATHRDAAYNLARWLIRNPQDAEDVLQEALLRAFRFFEGFRGGDARAWLLTIVRNSCYSWLERNRPREALTEYWSESTSPLEQAATEVPMHQRNPETEALRAAEADEIEAALQTLPTPLREVVILREMEDLSYREIADIAGIPIGTVMSRLARARAQLRVTLVAAGACP